jgi:ABC-2 type transport system permease protein
MVSSAISCFGAMLLIYFMPALTMLLPTGALGSMIAFTILILLIGVLVYRLSASLTFALGFTAVSELILLCAYFIKSEWLEGSVRKLFSSLSVTSRVETFTSTAILDLSAILYFITVAFIFVFFTVQSAEKARLG